MKQHTLRHSFASFLVNADRNLYEAGKLLGHTQVKTTMRYAHLADKTLAEAVNTVPLGKVA
ncbi:MULTISPECIES: tyrosine-type recombinase/integrase [Desulfonatronospira]|uniref:tyrosine-type recombinase/integrase n=1 Tax=Desulfonatronospira sp. MSAO_Bac3 TaxID=2293857 RepID=UPI001FC8EEF9|nr:MULTISPECIES: tyrosine-type recombinase/integrase [Desulfonatronospira]